MTTQLTASFSRVIGAKEDIHARLVRLAKTSLAYQRQHEILGDPHRDVSRHLPAMAVLAMEGCDESLVGFTDRLLSLARGRRGIEQPIIRNLLDDSFCLRSVVAAYHQLVIAGRIDKSTQEIIAAWLYELTLQMADGRALRRQGFEQWHLRNQNVPATMVYLVAHLLDQTQARQYDTQPLWTWADAQIVGWDLTWRDPDDSWLYQFIWIWSAFIHARLRRPELLTSANARRSFDFYRHLSLPGSGQGLIFGDSNPGDLLGAAVALMLGARLFDDSQYLCLALRYLDETERRGLHQNLGDRGPEMFNLYHWWPRELVPAFRVPRQSLLIQSPLPGRGWSLGCPAYTKRIKTTDVRFPFHGLNDNNWDAMYQVQDPQAYAQDKPDKIILADKDQEGDLFALMDLRAHGLHDHADALNLVTLTAQGRAWLVETTYEPRDASGLRWMHNVPLVLEGLHEPQVLRSWKADTWREVNPGDCGLATHQGQTRATAWLRHDSFDYVDFASRQFDIQRSLLFTPGLSVVVVDRLVALQDGEATIGQIWHSPATLQMAGSSGVMSQGHDRFHMDSAQSHAGQWQHTHRPALDGVSTARSDPFYFQQDRPTQVLLWHWRGHVKAGEEVVMAVRFGAEPCPVSLSKAGNDWRVHLGGGQVLGLQSFDALINKDGSQ